jgi:hypothetical protein
MSGKDLSAWIHEIACHLKEIGLELVVFAGDCGSGNWSVLCLLDKHNNMNPLAYNMLGLGDYSHAVKNLVNPLRDGVHFLIQSGTI